MMFQVLIMDEIRNVFYYLQMAGILDILIPFVLIFTVLFAVMKKIELFDDRQQIMVSLAITLLVIIPHITQSIPPEYDVVQIINNSLPSVVLIIFVLLMTIILLGFITKEKLAIKGFASSIAALVSILLVIFIFLNSAGYFQSSNIPYWLNDPQLGALIVVILMFGLITWFIVTPGQGKLWDKLKKGGEELADQLGLKG